MASKALLIGGSEASVQEARRFQFIDKGHPNRKVYTVTDAGREVLHQWLTSPQSLPALRDPFLTQLFFAASLSNAEIIKLLEDQHTQHSKLLAYYQQKIPFSLGAPVTTRGEVSREQMLRRQVLEYSLRREQTYLGWLEQAIEAVHRLLESDEEPDLLG